MPLFSEHISNMYYSGSPSYTSPSYGYKSSYSPLGTSYSASYLSPGGSYGNHSSLSSYSRAPLSSRWISSMSRSYSPMLTPISERGTASPIRINSPRRIPISKRSYGTPSYIQRPININTESIDVSRDRYRPKPTEPPPPPPTSASALSQQSDEPVKDNENSPFMPRVDGKPETGIDSSPGLQRSTIKRGRTVVRLHTIKRKEKDSPRKSMETSQLRDGVGNKQETPLSTVDDMLPEEPKESLSWREKLSDDLVYVDKKEKKSLGTKLVEKFIVKEVTEKDTKIDKSDIRSGEGTSHIIPETLLPTFEERTSSKSPDRRCSMEILAEQASLLDSLIRGENLSTATLDLSKIGIADETKNKFDSSSSIKRRKTDDKGNPLKTTKSDHSLHDNLNKSLKGGKDFKILTKRRSLKKSQSGGSICRLDSITEFPKEPNQIDLPAIQENRLSPKEQKPKLRTKITASVEISPPISPLKFRIENVIVEEKLHTPKKEISFSYDIDEIPIQEVTLQSPKNTLRRSKERNSVRKRSKTTGTEPISPEPDDGNFWAKIGKRETVYLIKRKQNIEAAKENDKKAFLWFPQNEETNDVSNDCVNDNSNILIKNNNNSLNQISRSDYIDEFKPNDIPPKENDDGEKSDGKLLNNVSQQIIESKSSDDFQKKPFVNNKLSLKENKTKPSNETNQDDQLNSGNKNTLKKLFRQDTETKEDNPDEINKIVNFSDKLSSSTPGVDQTETSQSIKNFNSSKADSLELSQSVPLVAENESSRSHKTSNSVLDLHGENKEVSAIEGLQPKDDLNVTTENNNFIKSPHVNTTTSLKAQPKSKDGSLKKDLNIIAENNADKNEPTSAIRSPPQNETRIEDLNRERHSKLVTKEIEESAKNNLSPKTITKTETLSEKPPLKSRAKSEDKSLEIASNLLAESIETDHKLNIDTDHSKTIPVSVKKTKVANKEVHTRANSEDKNHDKEFTSEKGIAIESSKSNIELKLSSEISAKIKIKPVISASNLQTEANCENNSVVDKDLKVLPEKIESNKSEVGDKTNADVSLSNESSAKPAKKQANTVLTLQTQAKSKIEGKNPALLVKTKQVELAQDVKSSVTKRYANMLENTKKTPPTETNKTDSKKKVQKSEVVEKNKDKEKTNSPPKDNICQTCKKSLASSPDSSKTNKLNITNPNDQSKLKPTQIKDKVPTNNALPDKPTDNEQVAKTKLDSSTENTRGSNLKTENNASTSQIPIVIETKNIPNHTVVSDTEHVQTSVPSQEKPGEETKAANNMKMNEGSSKLKQPSIKEVATFSHKIPVKEEKAVKPLIATPRPLQKRAQIIHSDSSDSSSEEDSSEEDSETSEDSGDFYECDNNPDGRTSTGSNDSGFDSSAPTSPASFLQIKKDCDVNCHRKCEKLTANLCGVNQRLLVEALATRTASKKGGDSPGPSSSNASSQLPDSDVGDSELELEQSTAYGIFRKTGRFTPPAKSIPRFRKYNIEDFQFIKVLGKGSFGKVLLAELRDTEYYYAVKCLKKDVVLEDDDVECTLIERKVLALGTNHPYLCHLFATFQTDSHLFFVMEYLNGGDLMFHIQQSGRFPEARARFYGAEIVSGLKFLHKRGIVYRDLKLDNILLDYEGHVRIADFGMCKLQIYLDKTADTFCGTPDYMAPEIIKGLKYNQTVDWWSFGVLLYEMLIGQSPFSGCDEDELFWSICNEIPSYPRFLSREGLTILTRLLDKDAKTRLGGTECMHGDVREQEFFHPVHWDKLERRELETPFKPRVRHPLDTQYFDRAFTGERPRLTAVEPHVLRSMDQEPFRGFSYTNPNATDR